MLSLGPYDTLGLGVVDGANDGIMLTEGKDDTLGLIDGIILIYTLGIDDTEGDKLGIMLSLGPYDTLGLDVADGTDEGVFLNEVTGLYIVRFGWLA